MKCPKISTPIVILAIFCLKTITAHECDTEDSPLDPKNVKHLIIDDFTGLLDKQLLTLYSNVETLIIRNSSLQPLNQNFVIPMVNLRKLFLVDSVAERVRSDISKCCRKIKEFGMIRSGLKGVSWDRIGTLPLEYLHLYQEKIPQLESNVLVDTKLKNLTIAHSGLSKIDNDAFNKLIHLEFLDLRGNSLKEINKEVFSHLTNLKTLVLSKNQLEKFTAEQLPSLPNLEEIDIGENPIKELNLEGVKTLAPKLSTVYISGIAGVDSNKTDGINLSDLSIGPIVPF